MGFCSMTISELIKSLVAYLEKESLILKEDEIWATNRVLEVLGLDGMNEAEVKSDNLEEILKAILDFAVEKGLCEDSIVYKDLFDTKVVLFDDICNSLYHRVGIICLLRRVIICV